MSAEPCPSCDRDLSYPGAPGHECYTYAEWRARQSKATTEPDAEMGRLRAEVARLRTLCIPLTDLSQELTLTRQELVRARAMSDAHFARAESAEAEVRSLRAVIEKEHCAACGNGMGLCGDCEADSA